MKSVLLCVVFYFCWLRQQVKQSKFRTEMEIYSRKRTGKKYAQPARNENRKSRHRITGKWEKSDAMAEKKAAE